ncbi:MAG: hypothetical protein J0L78_14060 [Planctomycetes bacterium]|nr:hypothetical protein [Planctomycetota bacterium]
MNRQHGSFRFVRAAAVAFGGWSLSAFAMHRAQGQVVFNPENGHYYERVLQTGIKWPAASSLASARSHLGVSGHLATITNQGERTFVNAQFGDIVGVWLGGFWDRNNASIWRWVTGEPWTFTAFHTGQPNSMEGNRAYLMLNPTGLAWYDAVEDDTANGFLIEYPAQPPVAPGQVAFQATTADGSIQGFTPAGPVTGGLGAGISRSRRISGGGSTGGGFVSATFVGEITDYADGASKIALTFTSRAVVTGYMQVDFDLSLPSSRFFRTEASGDPLSVSLYSSDGLLTNAPGRITSELLHVSIYFDCTNLYDGDADWTLWLSPYAAFVPAQKYTAGNVANGQALFISSLSAAPTVYDFENYANLAPIDRISPAIDLRLVNQSGAVVAETGKAFRSGVYTTPGRFQGGALLGESPGGPSGRILLEFDPPVEGVGAWMFDDNSSVANFASLVITDTLGQKHRTGVIDSTVGTGHGIDGFVGVSARLGIVTAEFESFLASNSAWGNNHEIDYLHVGKQLPSVSPNRANPCPGAPFTLTAKAPGATAFQWRRNGIAIPGETQATYVMNPATGRDAAVYDCRISGTPGVAGSDLTTPAFVTICAADLACDGQVNDSDFVVFLTAYNTLDCADPSMALGCPADFSGDGVVDDSDFQVFIIGYEQLTCAEP